MILKFYREFLNSHLFGFTVGIVVCSVDPLLYITIGGCDTIPDLSHMVRSLHVHWAMKVLLKVQRLPFSCHTESLGYSFCYQACVRKNK